MFVRNRARTLGDGPSDFYSPQAYDAYGNPLTQEQTGYWMDQGENRVWVQGTMNLVDLTKDAGVADSFTVQRAYELSPAYQDQSIRTNPLATVYATPEQMQRVETVITTGAPIPVASGATVTDVPIANVAAPAPAPAPVSAPAPAPAPAPATAPPSSGSTTSHAGSAYVNPYWPTMPEQPPADWTPGDWLGPGDAQQQPAADGVSKARGLWALLALVAPFVLDK